MYKTTHSTTVCNCKISETKNINTEPVGSTLVHSDNGILKRCEIERISQLDAVISYIL